MNAVDKAEGGAALLAGLVIVMAAIWAYRKLPSSADVAAAAQKLNPFNPDNIASTAANSAVQAVTGDPNQTTGGWLFDLFNPRAGLRPGEIINPDGSTSMPSNTGGATGAWGTPAPAAVLNTGGATGSWGTPTPDQTTPPVWMSV